MQVDFIEFMSVPERVRPLIGQALGNMINPEPVATTLSAENGPPRGWNGKQMALLVGGSVLLGAAFFTYLLWLYGEVEEAAEKSTSAWRPVASELAPRYAKLEKLVAEGVDNRQLAMELGEQFRLRIDRFRGTGQAVQQVAMANELEELFEKIDKSLAATPAASDLADRWKASIAGSSALQEALELFNVQVREQKQWRDSFGGAVLLAFIKLPEPSEVRVVTDLSNSRIQ
jgi:hypothetical protein